MKESEKQAQKKAQEKFNSVAGKKEVENQNQTNNVKQEGLGPINQKR